MGNPAFRVFGECFQIGCGGLVILEKDLIHRMVAARILSPHTKLATTRWWHSTTLAEDFGVTDAGEDDLYAAMDWLLARQDKIQKKLATCGLWLWLDHRAQERRHPRSG